MCIINTTMLKDHWMKFTINRLRKKKYVIIDIQNKNLTKYNTDL